VLLRRDRGWMLVAAHRAIGGATLGLFVLSRYRYSSARFHSLRMALKCRAERLFRMLAAGESRDADDAIDNGKTDFRIVRKGVIR
jgi:hypothetical protein